MKKIEAIIFQLVVLGKEDLVSLARASGYNYRMVSKAVKRLIKSKLILKRVEKRRIKLSVGNKPQAISLSKLALYCAEEGVHFADSVKEEMLSFIYELNQNALTAKQLKKTVNLSWDKVYRFIRILKKEKLVKKKNKKYFIDKEFGNLIGDYFSKKIIALPPLPKIGVINYPKAVQIHKDIIANSGGEAGILNEGNLKFTLDFIYQKKFKKDIEENLIYLAAFILRGIIQGHPFIDGNKRSGYEIAHTFLRNHGYFIKAKEKEIIDFVLDIAQGKLILEVIIKWLKKRLNRE